MKTDELFEQWCSTNQWAANTAEIKQFYVSFAEYVLKHQTDVMLSCLRERTTHHAPCDV